MKKKKILIIGYGNFGKLMAGQISDFAEVFVYDKNKIENIPDNIKIIKKTQVREMDYVIFSVPVQFIEDAVAEFKNFINPKAIVMDVASVKVFPLKVLKENFPNNQIVGTHPLFGPTSILKKIPNLKVVISNVSGSKKTIIMTKKFIEKKLGFITVEMTASEHDEQMAHIQALSHFIGFALREFDLKENLSLKTLAYRRMYALYKDVLNDTEDLFKTIQNFNPYAKEIRKEFIKSVVRLDKKCRNDYS